MRTKEQVLQQIEDSAMVAVVRGETTEQAMAVVENCIAGGIKAIELTFTVPFAHRVVEDLARKYGDQIILGAGTVLDSETARIAILSGAEFIVSPHFNPEVVKLCNRYRKAVMQGILTVTEAITAMEAGTDVLKLFPGELFGPTFIKAIKGPLPYARVMPTGGVTVDNVADWIKAGAVAVGAGSSLLKGDVKANAEAFMKNIRQARA
ncbi:MAG: bifunctional 2-keto-4-hydroxyglutarate aldolase/2-keto-3-deoxy-6-phosphogluconate aldolase [Acutalibacteraceae bacterium]|jgi:2-dehydro-3-deoxyphosphogluconate aldolase/(4S)-4-hydroxy-2-oxoglutarate aldolase